MDGQDPFDYLIDIVNDNIVIRIGENLGYGMWTINTHNEEQANYVTFLDNFMQSKFRNSPVICKRNKVVSEQTLVDINSNSKKIN
jgi:hypothetical protein